MSHYALAVFSDEPNEASFDRLLDPYSESNEEYYVFEPVPEEKLREKWNKFKEFNPDWTYEDWLDYEYAYIDGVYGNWYNPQGYYDYYTLDARDYMYDLIPQLEQVDPEDWPYTFKKSQYDWEKPDEEKLSEEELRKKWREYSTNGDGFLSERYYKERYVDEETFVRQCRYPTVPYAFVTPDGVWHAPGRVGWFAMSDETAESWDKYVEEWLDFIRNAPDCYVSLVDCHI